MAAVREIVARIAKRPETERHVAVRQLMILAGLRDLEEVAEREIQNMPLTIDIMENKVIGPAIRQGIEQGLAQGREEGREEGRRDEARRLFRHFLEKRFGKLPAWAESHLNTLDATQIEALSGRFLDAKTLEDLFR